MHAPYKLMCILAHPDDESIALGGTIAKYAAEGVEVSLVVATHGERGWFGPPEEYPGERALGYIREKELHAACQALGVRRLDFLPYIDGELDGVDYQTIVSQLVHLLREIRPQVVVTFGPDGLYGHPDHIAISQFTTAALFTAADTSYKDVAGLAAHQVLKLYHRVATATWFERFIPIFGDIVMVVDGIERRPNAWARWSVTTCIDARMYWETAWRAVLCHQTQLQHKDRLAGLTVDDHHCFWGEQEFYRAFSLVSAGRQIEHDFFTGINDSVQRDTPVTTGRTDVKQSTEIVITRLQAIQQ